jgi:CBS-domain-containing membrane protein
MSGLVCDVMTRDVLVARPEATFRELVRLIEDHHVHALPVVDELGRVLGIVAESDLLIKEELTEGHVRTPLQRRGRARPAGTTAGEIMTSPVVTIDSSQTLGQAARVFHQRHLGRLPVVEDDGRLIGIVTRSDLLTVFLRSDEDLLVAVQEAIAAAVDDSPSCTISATVDDGVVVLQGSAPLLSQVMVVGDRVRRVPGIVHLDVKATAVYDDVHPAMVGP